MPTRLIFDTTTLDEIPQLGNRTTYSAVVSACDALIASMESYGGVAAQVRGVLVQNGPRKASLEKAAA